VPNIELVTPAVTPNHAHYDKPTNQSFASHGKLTKNGQSIQVQVSGLGRHFNFTLHENRNLVDPQFVHLLRRTNESFILNDHHIQQHIPCFYHGTVEHASKRIDGEIVENDLITGSAALSICDGLVNIILHSLLTYLLTLCIHFSASFVEHVCLEMLTSFWCSSV